mmetsp:Transcript_55780/g.149347  ORF Transcript_55780/g.149347 Transcript_55780/m.149347 type:complete len:97 (-) Transcript_55780:65-355(-)
MVTIFEGAHITCGCLSGCIVMEEMAGVPWWRYCCYWLSVALIIAGILIVNRKSADAQLRSIPSTSSMFSFHVHSFVPAEEEEEEQQQGRRVMEQVV